MSRISTAEGNLARLGFGDPHRAAAILNGWYDDLGDNCDHLIADILASADPDLAISGLERLTGERAELLTALCADQGWARRLISVLGASVALNQHLGAHPVDADVLTEPPGRRDAATLRHILLTAVGADPDAAAPVADPSRSDDLRVAYRREILRIAADHPGRTVELRVPPYAAIQLALDEGSTHRRGTPPNVVEIDGVTLLALATGRLSWADGRAAHRVRASGAHSDLSALFPLPRIAA